MLTTYHFYKLPITKITMFSGIIETLGEVILISQSSDNKAFNIRCNFVSELILGQSIAHNGVCLTVSKLGEAYYEVVAVAETLKRTNLEEWKIGDRINLERCLKLGDRLDGHLVQGHIDTVGKVLEITKNKGSWLVKLGFEKKYAPLLVQKGSVCVDGVSLTVVEVGVDWFSIALIPFTLEVANFKQLAIGKQVNLEFDIIGKYVNRMGNVTFPLSP